MREARRWYRKAMELAEAGDTGALAALCTLVLAMRCSEVVSIRVCDFDDAEAEWDTLHIPKSKTRKGVRALEIPVALRPLFHGQAMGKRPKDWLFYSGASKDGRQDYSLVLC